MKFKNSTNARFWDYFSSPVKITLKPNQELKYYKHSYNGEGYDINITTYKYENNKVICTIFDDGWDCDGRLSSYNVFECSINKLKSHFNIHNNLFMPDWQRVESSQRDYAAEEMGF